MIILLANHAHSPAAIPKNLRRDATHLGNITIKDAVATHTYARKTKNYNLQIDCDYRRIDENFLFIFFYSRRQ